MRSNSLAAFELHVVGQLIEAGHVPPRGNQQVAVVVRVTIQNRQRVYAPLDDRPLAVVAGRGRLAQEAARLPSRQDFRRIARLRRILVRENVTQSPGGPKLFVLHGLPFARKVSNVQSSVAFARQQGAGSRTPRVGHPLREMLGRVVGWPR